MYADNYNRNKNKFCFYFIFYVYKKSTSPRAAPDTLPFDLTRINKGMQHCSSLAPWQGLQVLLSLQHLLKKNRAVANHSSPLHTSNIPQPSLTAVMQLRKLDKILERETLKARPKNKK